MQRAHLEHVVAAAAEVTGETELVVVGSQAILASFPNAPEIMLRSQGADLYPHRRPERADEIDGSLGDGSMFHRTYGYYAYGVGPETAKAPSGWQERLIRLEVPGRTAARVQAVALCLEPHDLVLAKCVAGRERDWDFAEEALRHRLVELGVLLGRIDGLPIDGAARDHVRAMLEGIAHRLRSG